MVSAFIESNRSQTLSSHRFITWQKKQDNDKNTQLKTGRNEDDEEKKKTIFIPKFFYSKIKKSQNEITSMDTDPHSSRWLISRQICKFKILTLACHTNQHAHEFHQLFSFKWSVKDCATQLHPSIDSHQPAVILMKVATSWSEKIGSCVTCVLYGEGRLRLHYSYVIKIHAPPSPWNTWNYWII